ncbi:unnamed protein product [Choristocarpus tenellus]
MPGGVGSCQQEGCDVHATFGLEGKDPIHCARHKSAGMIDVVHRSCETEGCRTRPTFGKPGGKPIHCSKHKSPDMVDVRNSRCAMEGCNKNPSFAPAGKTTPVRCGEHKLEGMLNVRKPACNHESGCKTQASFGPVAGNPSRCAAHRTEHMVDVKNHSRFCQEKGCWKEKTCGFPEGRRAVCLDHKAKGMIKFPPGYRYLGSTPRKRKSRSGGQGTEVNSASTNIVGGVIQATGISSPPTSRPRIESTDPLTKVAGLEGQIGGSTEIAGLKEISGGGNVSGAGGGVGVGVMGAEAGVATASIGSAGGDILTAVEAVVAGSARADQTLVGSNMIQSTGLSTDTIALSSTGSGIAPVRTGGLVDPSADANTGTSTSTSPIPTPGTNSYYIPSSTVANITAMESWLATHQAAGMVTGTGFVGALPGVMGTGSVGEISGVEGVGPVAGVLGNEGNENGGVRTGEIVAGSSVTTSVDIGVAAVSTSSGDNIALSTTRGIDSNSGTTVVTAQENTLITAHGSSIHVDSSTEGGAVGNGMPSSLVSNSTDLPISGGGGLEGLAAVGTQVVDSISEERGGNDGSGGNSSRAGGGDDGPTMLEMETAMELGNETLLNGKHKTIGPPNPVLDSTKQAEAKKGEGCVV